MYFIFGGEIARKSLTVNTQEITPEVNCAVVNCGGSRVSAKKLLSTWLARCSSIEQHFHIFSHALPFPGQFSTCCDDIQQNTGSCTRSNLEISKPSNLPPWRGRQFRCWKLMLRWMYVTGPVNKRTDRCDQEKFEGQPGWEWGLLMG